MDGSRNSLVKHRSGRERCLKSQQTIGLNDAGGKSRTVSEATAVPASEEERNVVVKNTLGGFVHTTKAVVKTHALGVNGDGSP